MQYMSIKEVLVKHNAKMRGLSREEAHEQRNGKLNRIAEPLGLARYFCCLLSCFGVSNQLDTLRRIVPNAAQVKRNNRIMQIDPVTLSVGDIVNVACNDYLPADIRILDASECLFSTKHITGKTECLAADPHIACNVLSESPNMALVGYQCTAGHCVGVVVAALSGGHGCGLSGKPIGMENTSTFSEI